jgi:hypothetical protein
LNNADINICRSVILPTERTAIIKHSNVKYIRTTKLRIMRWAENVAWGMLIGYWWESQEERYQKEDQNVGGWIILRRILER